jgi:hypothetical protein
MYRKWGIEVRSSRGALAYRAGDFPIALPQRRVSTWRESEVAWFMWNSCCLDSCVAAADLGGLKTPPQQKLYLLPGKDNISRAQHASEML